ncbi:hypothetical protein K9M79_05900 [Candidatus Woesearchaeota archaeon]|nr:hypothetical protein [Candidatus Woesearchaeota archaeon]
MNKLILVLLCCAFIITGCAKESVQDTPAIQPDVTSKVTPKTTDAPIKQETQQPQESSIDKYTEIEITITEDYLNEAKDYMKHFRQMLALFRADFNKIQDTTYKPNVNVQIEKYNGMIVKLQRSVDAGEIIKPTTGEPYSNQKDMFEKELVALNIQVKAVQEAFRAAEA